MRRDELYELVWQSPMNILARRFGKTGSGLRNLCQSLNVPIPHKGYWAWARKHMFDPDRHEVRPPLPPPGPGTPLEVDLTPRVRPEPTPLLPPTPKGNAKPKPLHVYARTSRLLLREHQEFFRPFGPGTIDIEVTTKVGMRALQLGSSLFRLAEKSGHEVIPGQFHELPIGYGRLSISNEIFDVKIRELTTETVIARGSKRLAEQQDASYKRGDGWLLPHERPIRHTWDKKIDDEKRPFDSKACEYNGRLSLEVPGVGIWADTDNVAVEDRLPTIIHVLEKHAIKVRVERERREANQLAWEREVGLQSGSRASLKRQRDPYFRKRRRFDYALEKARELQDWRLLCALLDEIGHWESPTGETDLDKFIRHLREMVDAGRLTVQRMTSEIAVKKMFFDD